MAAPSQNLSELMIAAFEDAFHTFDTDNDGYLSFKELADLLVKLGVPVTQDEINDMKNEVDIDDNGTINSKEFLQLMARKMRDMDNEEEYIESFKIFDKNDDDLISIEELREVMTILGKHVWNEVPTDEELEQMIKDADVDGDGFLNYSEFINKIQSIH